MSDWFDEVLIENPFDEDPSASNKDKETSVDDLPTKKRQRRPKPRRGTKREDNIYYSSDSHATTAEEGTTRDRLSYRELKEVQRGAKILSKVFLETLNDWIGYRDQAFPPEVAAVLLDTFADEVALGGYLPKETEGIYYSGDRFVFPEEVREDMDKHFATTYEYGKELGDINSDQIDEYKVLDTNKDRGRRGEMFGFRDDVFKIKKHEPDYRLEPIDNREERLRELSRKSRQRQIDKSLSQLDEQVPPEYLNYQYDRLVANPEIPRPGGRGQHVRVRLHHLGPGAHHVGDGYGDCPHNDQRQHNCATHYAASQTHRRFDVDVDIDEYWRGPQLDADRTGY